MDELVKILDAGWKAVASGDADRVRDCAKQVLAEYPQDAEALTLLGTGLRLAGELPEALALFEKAHGLEPGYPEPALSAAELHIDFTGDWEAALRYGMKVLYMGEARPPDKAVAHLVRAEGWLGLDSAESALEELDQVPPADRRNPDQAYTRGRCMYELRRDDEAFEALAEAIELREDHADAHYALALIHQARSEFEEMVWEFRRVLEIEGELPLAPHAMSRDGFAALAEQALAELPEDLREQLRDVAVVVEDRPSAALVEDGVDPRLLGLFDGLPYPDKGSGVARGPDRIVLFQRNLEAFCRDTQEIEREIRTTVIHEAGHFFGMDEEELARRGLD